MGKSYFELMEQKWAVKNGLPSIFKTEEEAKNVIREYGLQNQTEALNYYANMFYSVIAYNKENHSLYGLSLSGSPAFKEDGCSQGENCDQNCNDCRISQRQEIEIKLPKWLNYWEVK